MSKTTDWVLAEGINEPYLHEPCAESLLPDSMVFLTAAFSDAKSKILNGEISYKEALYRKKLMATVLDNLFNDKEVKEFLESEFAKEGAKKIAFNDAEIAYSSRKSFSYDKCGDSEYNRLKWEADKANRELKEREKFLQLLSKPITQVYEETGEVETIYPAAYTSTDFFTVTIKK